MPREYHFGALELLQFASVCNCRKIVAFLRATFVCSLLTVFCRLDAFPRCSTAHQWTQRLRQGFNRSNMIQLLRTKRLLSQCRRCGKKTLLLNLCSCCVRANTSCTYKLQFLSIYVHHLKPHCSNDGCCLQESGSHAWMSAVAFICCSIGIVLIWVAVAIHTNKRRRQNSSSPDASEW